MHLVTSIYNILREHMTKVFESSFTFCSSKKRNIAHHNNLKRGKQRLRDDLDIAKLILGLKKVEALEMTLLDDKQRLLLQF